MVKLTVSWSMGLEPFDVSGQLTPGERHILEQA